MMFRRTLATLASACKALPPIGVVVNSPSFTTPKITAATSYWVRITNGCGPTDSVTASITLQ